MQPDDLVVTDLQGHKISGYRNPSSELAMHLLIYRRRPDVFAICHAHPPVATGYAAAGMPLNQALLSECVMALGAVPVAGYGTPGTPELSEAIEPLIQDHNAILLANHGVVTYGHDLLTAFYRMETTEQFARVALVTVVLGKQVLLSGEDVEKLLAARTRYGIQSAPGGISRPVSAEDAEAAAIDRITLTRRELEALVEEAVKKDRIQR